VIGWLIDRVDELEQREYARLSGQKSPSAEKSWGRTWPVLSNQASTSSAAGSGRTGTADEGGRTSSSTSSWPVQPTGPNGRRHHQISEYDQYSYDRDERENWEWEEGVHK
jgi:hypothetical protein